MTRRPEVEPLGDVRWARIEQSLMQRLDELPSNSVESRAVPSRARTRAWPMALVGTFAIAAAAAVSLHVTRPHLSASSSRVVTEASASHVTVAENSLDVSPESGIEIREEERATVLTLERGEVALHVAPRDKDRPFLVEAGDVHVRVVGTEFTVRRVGVGATVAVRRGIVEVRENGELAVLHAGDHWPSEGKSDSPIAVASLPALAPVPAPSPAPAFAAPAPVSRTVTRPRTASPPSPAPPGSAAITSLAIPPAPPPDTALSTAPSAQSRYEAAAQVERSDPARALRAYMDLAQGSDAWAQNALYAAGRLQADRGARPDASRLLEEYLRRFPRGSNAQDARALRDSLRPR